MKKENQKDAYAEKLTAFVQAQVKEPVALKYNEGDKQLTIKVFPVISFGKRMELISSIVGMVFIEGAEGKTEYRPELVKFVKRRAVVAYFTDIKLPENLDDLWALLCHTPLYKDVARIVGDDVGSILAEADEAIKIRCAEITDQNGINGLLRKVSSVIDSFAGELNGVDIGQLLEMFKSLPNMSEDELVKSVLKNRNETAVKTDAAE